METNNEMRQFDWGYFSSEKVAKLRRDAEEDLSADRQDRELERLQDELIENEIDRILYDQK